MLSILMFSILGLGLGIDVTFYNNNSTLFILISRSETLKTGSSYKGVSCCLLTYPSNHVLTSFNFSITSYFYSSVIHDFLVLSSLILSLILSSFLNVYSTAASLIECSDFLVLNRVNYLLRSSNLLRYSFNDDSSPSPSTSQSSS